MSNAPERALAEQCWPLLRDGASAPHPRAEDAALLPLAAANRLLPLLQTVWAEHPALPAPARQELASAARRAFLDHTLRLELLRPVTPVLTELPGLMLRGLGLAGWLYPDAALRPWVDVDLLVSRRDIPAWCSRLEALGFHRPPHSHPDAYFLRHHLHLQRVRSTGTASLPVELHWALDHPLALHCPDLQGIRARAVSRTAEGFSFLTPHPDDLWLILAAHLCKHAPALPLWLQEQVPERLVRQGHLLHLLDLALLSAHVAWPQVEARAADWHMQREAVWVLHALHALWPGLVEKAPDMPAPRLPAWRSRALRHLSAAPRSVRRRAVFRPIRLLDAVDALLPPRAFLRCRYGGTGPLRRVRHTLVTLYRLTCAAAETAWWSLRRRHRAEPDSLRNKN